MAYCLYRKAHPGRYSSEGGGGLTSAPYCSECSIGLYGSPSAKDSEMGTADTYIYEYDII